MPSKGIDLNRIEDRTRIQKKAEWWKTWGSPRFRIIPDTDPRDDYSPTIFLP